MRPDVDGCTAVMPLGDVLWANSVRADRTALVLPDVTLTYGELIEESVAVGRALVASGVTPGDRVGLLMPGSAEFLAAFFGTVMVGATVVPINTRYRRRELAYLVKDAGLVGLLSTDVVDDYVDLLALAAQLVAGEPGAADPGALEVAEFPDLRFIANLGHKSVPSALGRTDFLGRGSQVDDDTVGRRRRAVRVRDTAAIFYTSGTTAEPRGCMHTHESLGRNWAEIARRLTLAEGDALWAPCPIFHLSGIGPMLGAVTVGASIITSTHLDVEAIKRSFSRMAPTMSYALFPQITADVLEGLGEDKHVLEAIRVAVQVGTPEQMRRLHAEFPRTRFVQVYGLTEAAGLVTLGAPDDPEEARCTTVGWPLPGSELRIVDVESGEACAPGTPGEVQFLSYSACEGYLNDPEKSATSVTEDGWFRTGDRAVAGEDGMLRFLGRIKDMLKVGGENVAAVEIESLLDAHPAVKMSQVVGAPDDRLGEVPVGFVELREGHSVSADELIEHCRGDLASFKVPRQVLFVEEWPMSSTKIQKFKLRELIR